MLLYRWVSLESYSNLLSGPCQYGNVSDPNCDTRHHPGAVLLVNWNMSHVPSLPVLENVLYHVLWISAVSFSCHKLHSLSVGIRGQESSLTSLGNGETRLQKVAELLCATCYKSSLMIYSEIESKIKSSLSSWATHHKQKMPVSVLGL